VFSYRTVSEVFVEMVNLALNVVGLLGELVGSRRVDL